MKRAVISSSMNLTSRTTTTTTATKTAAAGTRTSPTNHSSNDGNNNKNNKHKNDDDAMIIPCGCNDNDRNDKHFRKKTKSTNVCSSFFVRLKFQWSLLSPTSKVASTFVWIYFFQHVVLGLWDYKYHQIGVVANNDDPTTTSTSTETSFAVVINTYKRPDRLRDAVRHYADTCGRRAGISQVFVVWCEQDITNLPTPESFFEPSRNNIRKDKSPIPNRAQVQILQKSNSLNSRFEPIDSLQSTSVFMVDDDLRVACPSLLHAFHAWKVHPDSMVGYYPRLASPPRNYNPDKSSNTNTNTNTGTELIYHTWPIVFYRHAFNLVLTKASFLHSKYLKLYTYHYPQAIKDHVDQHMNCEDIAMSMLVANYTKYMSGGSGGGSGGGGKPANPIYVEGSVSDTGLFGGISTGTGHMSTRSECLSKLTDIFIQQGWDPPFLDYQVSLGENSWIRHAPGFWWQYRPSTFFEWLSFANTFT